MLEGTGLTARRMAGIGCALCGFREGHENQTERRALLGAWSGPAGGAMSGRVGREVWFSSVSDMSRTGMQSGSFPERFRERHGASAKALDRGVADGEGSGESGGRCCLRRGGAEAGLLLSCEPEALAGAASAGVVFAGEGGDSRWCGDEAATMRFFVWTKPFVIRGLRIGGCCPETVAPGACQRASGS